MAELVESRHLLTVLHAAERTGPPLLALQFLRWLREQRPSWQLSTLFLDAGGPLVDDFSELGAVVVNGPDESTGPEQHPWLSAGVRSRRVRRTLARLGQTDLVHVHCAGSMRSVPLLPPAPILCHVHELSVGQDFHLNRTAAKYLPHATAYLAVSEAVREELLARFKVDPARVERQWGFVDEVRLAESSARARERGPDGEFVVLTSGVRNWRKAPELFVRVALRCRYLYPEVRWKFQWIGGADWGSIESTVAELQLEDLVSFVPHQSDPLRWIAGADVFLLPAREDAFPLVSVEAAALGRPLVSFDSGGTPELIRNAGCGEVVPFPDVDGVCNALARLAGDPIARAAAGEAGRKFASERLVLSTAGPSLLATIESVMARA